MRKNKNIEEICYYLISNDLQDAKISVIKLYSRQIYIVYYLSAHTHTHTHTHHKPFCLQYFAKDEISLLAVASGRLIWEKRLLRWQWLSFTSFKNDFVSHPFWGGGGWENRQQFGFDFLSTYFLNKGNYEFEWKCLSFKKIPYIRVYKSILCMNLLLIYAHEFINLFNSKSLSIYMYACAIFS